MIFRLLSFFPGASLPVTRHLTPTTGTRTTAHPSVFTNAGNSGVIGRRIGDLLRIYLFSSWKTSSRGQHSEENDYYYGSEVDEENYYGSEVDNDVMIYSVDSREFGYFLILCHKTHLAIEGCDVTSECIPESTAERPTP